MSATPTSPHAFFQSPAGQVLQPMLRQHSIYLAPALGLCRLPQPPLNQVFQTVPFQVNNRRSHISWLQLRPFHALPFLNKTLGGT